MRQFYYRIRLFSIKLCNLRKKPQNWQFFCREIYRPSNSSFHLGVKRHYIPFCFFAPEIQISQKNATCDKFCVFHVLLLKICHALFSKSWVNCLFLSRPLSRDPFWLKFVTGYFLCPGVISRFWHGLKKKSYGKETLVLL